MEADNPPFRLHRVSGSPVSDAELLADLKRVAAQSGKTTVGQKEYRERGSFDDSTISRRFGSWNNALRAAELGLNIEQNISDERLFENILALWIHYGRQPRRSELAMPPSIVSQTPYARRFGSWSTALAHFVEFANAADVGGVPGAPVQARASGRRTSRDPSLRLRFKVLLRDRFTCQSCGASPAHQPVELHVDHILPWSEGGETTLENLRTLCSSCNLGKGALIE